MVFIGDVFLKEKVKIDFTLKDVILNLEYPLSKNGIPAKNKILLGCENNYLLDTFHSIKGVNLANNHIFDYGLEGFEDTISFLEQNNIPYCGINGKFIQLENCKILGFCSLTSTPVKECGKYKLNILEEIDFEYIKNIKKEHEYLIIILHWGLEEFKMPRYEDVKLAHKLIDIGVDLIIGHHPHVIQPIEIYKGKYIFYSLGNFIFPDLNEVSFFDGKEFKQYKEKRSLRNKIGIVVNLENNKIDYFTIYYDNKLVIKKKYKIPKIIPHNERDFILYKKKISKFLMLENFLKNPRIPSISNIKNFFKV